MPVSVMRLTNINKGIIKLLPQIVTLIILITAIPQLAKLHLARGIPCES